MNIKKYFNGKGTIGGWAALLRGLIPAIVLNLLLDAEMIFGIDISPVWLVLIIPAFILCAWFGVSTTKKRMQAFGWTGGWLNILFPNLTDATYPNGKKSE